MDKFERMAVSLEGLSVGDAFGERFFVRPEVLVEALRERFVPARAPWAWTDDTAMALSVVEVLRERGTLDCDALAERFARRYQREPGRGYGGRAHEILSAIAAGTSWSIAAGSVFGGQGSMGNGAAMRVAPLGAFFADEPLARVVEEAERSAVVTHAHPEGRAGAVAVAVAAACFARGDGVECTWATVLEVTPAGATRAGLVAARALGASTSPVRAAEVLGSGARVISEDTVPFSVWCALRHPDDYREALWATVSGLGDRDTTCAIVGGLVALRSRPPPEWVAAREPLPSAPG
jgi:ADP-ribosylglycohydrolase